MSTKKSELNEIYQRVYDLRGFSEDFDKSLTHRLVMALFQTVQSNDTKRSEIAAKCLGELGPSDLGTLILKLDAQKQTYKVVSNMKRFFFLEKC